MNRSSIVLSLICGVFAGSSNAVVQSFVINQGASRNCFRSSHPSTNHFSRAFSIRGGNGSALNAAAASPTSEIDDTSNSIEEYHLIWSPNFWKKLIVSFGFWAILGLVQSKYSTFVFMRYHSASCHSPMDFVLPLLSSSCCAIQLIINTISGLGCAGFNTYLGPIRPLFLSIFLILTWKQMNQRHPVWTLVSLPLAFLPEGVHLLNTLTTQKLFKPNAMTNDIQQNQLLPVNAKITLNIPTMGCVACVNKVDSTIRGCSFSTNIQQEKSWLKDEKGGVAELIVSTENKEGVDKVIEEVKRAVGNAGFTCDVECVQIQ